MMTSPSTNSPVMKPEHALFAGGTHQVDQIKSVSWKSHQAQTTTTWTGDAGMPETDIEIRLQGTLVLVVAATALFTTFVLSGITFNLVNPGGAGATSYNFTYTGSQSASYIQSLFAVGANITLG